MQRTRNESGFIKSLLLRAIIGLILFGVVVFDAGSIAWNYFSADSTADDMALELVNEARDDRVTRVLQQQARQLAREKNVKLLKLEMTEDRVTVEIRRESTTILVGRIGAIADWARVTATGSAPTS